jgi:hypothetical protein
VADNDYLSETDMKWVSPCSGCAVPTEFGNFDVDYTAIPVENRFRIIYLDVSATGNDKNVWDIHAGPHPDFFTDRGRAPLVSDVNERNLQIANDPAIYRNFGLNVVAVGRMPLQHFNTSPATLPLVPLPIALGEGAVFATIFDYDVPDPWGPNSVITMFQIDTLPISIFNIEGKITTPPVSDPQPTLTERFAACDSIRSCDGHWLRPQYAMGITSDAFAGGTLTATYTPNQDELVWSVLVTDGRPFLTR